MNYRTCQVGLHLASPAFELLGQLPERPAPYIMAHADMMSNSPTSVVWSQIPLRAGLSPLEVRWCLA
jgi:hypothetical protein